MDPVKRRSAFNADAFAFSVADADLATDYRRGTSRRNQFRLNNGINNWDLIISKKTQLWNEASGLELRFEMFNAFNHAQFSSADLNIRNKARGSFGTFTNTSDARVIQLGAHQLLVSRPAGRPAPPRPAAGPFSSFSSFFSACRCSSSTRFMHEDPAASEQSGMSASPGRIPPRIVEYAYGILPARALYPRPPAPPGVVPS